jgi:Zn-dependent M28 family amino/carboxypeptidase
MRKFLLVVALLAASVAAFPFQTPGVKDDKTAARPTSKIINAEQLLEDVRILSSDAMEGRGVGTRGSAMARAYVLRRFDDAGLRPLGASYEKPFPLPDGEGKKGKKETESADKKEAGKKEADKKEADKKDVEAKGTNIVGFVRGKSQPERFIVVTAHYDHLGIRNNQIYNGADDNASGVAALLQLAAHFARVQPENSMIFAALDAEESGLLGAFALVAELQSEKIDFELNVNLDMVSHSERGELYASGAYHTPALRPLLETVAARAPAKLLLGHDRPEQGQDDWTRQSDQFAFHKVGIPFVYFGVEDHKDYHKPTDDFETITPKFFVNATETILDALRTFDANLTSITSRKM